MLVLFPLTVPTLREKVASLSDLIIHKLIRGFPPLFSPLVYTDIKKLSFRNTPWTQTCRHTYVTYILAVE